MFSFQMKDSVRVLLRFFHQSFPLHGRNSNVIKGKGLIHLKAPDHRHPENVLVESLNLIAVRNTQGNMFQLHKLLFLVNIIECNISHARNFRPDLAFFRTDIQDIQKYHP